MKNAKILKDSIIYKNIAISPDYSKSKRLKVGVLIRTRVQLNKQLKNEKPNADYYFSIRCGKIIIVNKQNKQAQLPPLDTNAESTVKNRLESLIDRVLSSKLEPILKRVNDLNSDVTSTAMVIPSLKEDVNKTKNETNQLKTKFEGLNSACNELVFSMKEEIDCNKEKLFSIQKFMNENLENNINMLKKQIEESGKHIVVNVSGFLLKALEKNVT